MKEPQITVGILSGKEIEFFLPESFVTPDGTMASGIQKAVFQKGKIYWQGKAYNELSFSPIQDTDTFFELKDVTIGINFHWERKETQRFKGSLKIIVEEERLTAINVISIEEYLTSVISSEMSATASLSLLKAHAVISRSWLVHKLRTRNILNEELRMKDETLGMATRKENTVGSSSSTSDASLIKWYDHEAHTHFDVCADDHCQRYQGITRTSTPQAIEAVSSTRGEVLVYEGEICDTRFSKCCGGAFEEFQNCWENVRHPYLTGQRDASAIHLPDLTIEKEAEKWIRTSPSAFCNTQDKRVLSQVLNNYDQETIDFYRWKVSYTQQELSALVHKRSGINFGEIIDLIPVERGTSGRLVRLKIVGTLQTLIIGKELEIRRTLSPSHLYSSAFVVDKEGEEGQVPTRFTFTGAGWGHGVGLCQIGAAVMGEQGYNYKDILSHYYPGSVLENNTNNSKINTMMTIRDTNHSMSVKRRNPWNWIPTLYFAEGLPYVAVMTIAVIMYKRLGLSNTEITLYTSWLYLPWTIKPLWSPFVDLVKTKRSWIIAMQGLIAAGFAGIAFFIPTTHFVQLTLAFFWLMAFSSATYDIAADGFYMLGLNNKEQSFFVGIRNTFYRFANIFGQGILVMLAGWLETSQGNIPLAWSITFYLMAGLFLALTLYHRFILPHPDTDIKREGLTASKLLEDFLKTFISFFQKKHLGLMFFFLLTYRLGESQLAKIASPFLLDDAEQGGLALSTATVGMIYGTIGVIALLLGGIISGFLVSRDGFKKWILPMALAINLPDLLYVWMAAATPDNPLFISICVAIEQLGYGFGFTAYMLYLIYIAEGEHKTAHYAIGTGFMALGMMIPGMPAGWIQEHIGYTNFFIWVCICTIPGIIASLMIRNRLDDSFGKKI